MTPYEPGDDIRIDIPDTDDPDFREYHGRKGTVVAIIADDASTLTGDERDDRLFRVEFENGECRDFRWRDLRPHS